MRRLTTSFILVVGSILLVSCSGSAERTSAFTVTLLQPQGTGCNYAIAPVQLTTLTSLSDLKGSLGQVLTTPLDIDSRKDILGSGYSLRPVDVSFIKSGDTYFPADYNSLIAASLYYAVERGYKTYAALDPKFDLLSSVPNIGENTWILHEAKQSESTGSGSAWVSDNAQYISIQDQSTPQLKRNFIFSFPTQQISEMPLSVNIGVMAHEYSHLVFNHYFWEPAASAGVSTYGNKPTEQTLSALDEGVADYIGFMSTQDPGFFECSFPGESRDLSKTKSFSPDVVANMQSTDDSFDPHSGGAVFAAINYEIGTALGNPQLNAKLVAQLIPYLLQCPDVKSSQGIAMNFRDVGACHARLAADENTRSTIRRIYNKYLGSYGSLQ